MFSFNSTTFSNDDTQWYTGDNIGTHTSLFLHIPCSLSPDSLTTVHSHIYKRSVRGPLHDLLTTARDSLACTKTHQPRSSRTPALHVLSRRFPAPTPDSDEWVVTRLPLTLIMIPSFEVKTSRTNRTGGRGPGSRTTVLERDPAIADAVCGSSSQTNRWGEAAKT